MRHFTKNKIDYIFVNNKKSLGLVRIGLIIKTSTPRVMAMEKYIHQLQINIFVTLLAQMTPKF